MYTFCVRQKTVDQPSSLFNWRYVVSFPCWYICIIIFVLIFIFFFTSADLETITSNANQSNGCNQSDFDYLKQKRNCDRCLSVCSLVLHCNTICSGRCFFSRGRVADSILIILLDVWILDRCGRLCWLN